MIYLRLQVHGTDVWLPSSDENRQTLERMAAASNSSIESIALTRRDLIELARDDSPHYCLRIQ